MSLRRNLTIALFVLGILALASALSLVAFTTYMSGAVTTLTDALGSVYLAQRAEIDLLGHARTANATVASVLEADLHAKIQEAKVFAQGTPEEESLARAEQHVNSYLAETRASPGLPKQALPEFEPAVDSLHNVVETNLRNAEAAQVEAQRLDRIGDRLGIIVAVLLIAGVAGVSVWLVAFAFRPVFAIRNAMRDFARGNRSARAPERGPAELRIIASQFNAMADSLARQRENQLAFLAGVAHDLRNPLSVLKLSTVTTSPERFSIIQRQVGYLDRMIGDLLDASRIEAGQLELRLERQDARTLVKDVYDLFRDVSANHKLSISVPDSPVLLFCDALRIGQVLNNLVSNAIKYSPKGGPVEIVLKDLEDAAIISVTDQGLGIPANQLHDIFEPFTRARLTKDQIPGIGLGLSVARRIVEAHRGSLELQSEVAKGTTFFVKLPHRAGQAVA
jgi:signal transduction histidine kinase